MPRFFEGQLSAPRGRFAVCVARFNSFITEQLLKGALDAFARHGLPDDELDVLRVPGAFELPALARRLAEQGQYAGIVCLGAVIRGQTPHFEYVSSEAARGIGSVALGARCPVIFGVLTCDTVEQAIERSGVKAGNKGAEAAAACMEMADLIAKLPRVSGEARLAALRGKKK
jgi:6,7-dimethyl-8-ribityllumazine synthase